MLEIFIDSIKLNPSKSETLFFRSRNDGYLSKEDIIKEIVNKHSSITEADATAVMCLLDDVVLEGLCNGMRVSIPGGFLYPMAKGKCKTHDEHFDPRNKNSGHSVVVRFQPSNDINETVTEKIQWKRISKHEALQCLPDILAVTNACKNEEKLCVNSIIKLKGDNLSFNQDDDEQGLFLINKKTKIRLTLYSHISNNSINVSLPKDIEPGNYTFQLVTKPYSKLLNCKSDVIHIE